MKLERELMRGAAPTAVMQVLAGGEKYGYELVESLARQSNGVLGIGQSTLYPLLYNLEAKGLVTSRVDETGPRPRRFYRLTLRGRPDARLDWRQIIASSNLPAELATAVTQVVGKSRLWRSEKASVATELVSHFQDGLEAGQSPQDLLMAFGDSQ